MIEAKKLKANWNDITSKWKVNGMISIRNYYDLVDGNSWVNNEYSLIPDQYIDRVEVIGKYLGPVST